MRGKTTMGYNYERVMHDMLYGSDDTEENDSADNNDDTTEEV